MSMVSIYCGTVPLKPEEKGHNLLGQCPNQPNLRGTFGNFMCQIAQLYDEDP